MRESQDARSFRKLYHGLFPRAPEDSLSNYTHLRTLVSQKQSKGDVQIDLVRSILGPTSRGYGGMQVVLKSIAITPRTSEKALREAAIHRAVSLSWTSEARVLPLLSHFITRVLPEEKEDDKDEASSSSSSSNGKRTSTPRASSTYLVLVFPFLEQGTLFDCVAKKLTSKLRRQKIGEDEQRWVIVEAALALQRCHERGVVHRDVKAENILVDTLHGTPKLRLADFGMSIWIDETRRSEGKAVEDQGDSTLCGTWDYLSPETATQRRTGPPSDVWALGCVCVWLLTGSTPFADDKSHDQIVDRIAVGNWEAARAQLPDTLSYECLDMLEGMLQVDVGERITIQRILRHPFLKPELPRRAIVDSVGGAVQQGRARLRVPRASTPPSRSERSGLSDPKELQMRMPFGEMSSRTQTQTPTSLRSAMIKIQTESEVVDKAKEKDGRPRRTPFGVVRLPASSSSPLSPERPALRTISPSDQPPIEKEKDANPSQRDRSEKQEKEAELALTQRKCADASTTWGGGLGTRGIPPLRQRTGNGGRMAITPEGSVAVVTRKGEPPRQQMTTFVIDATGSILTDCRSTTPKVHRVSGGLDPFLENIYEGACRWLDRVRARTIVAAFTLPPDEKENKDEALPTAACLVRANRDFAVSWQGTHGVLQGSIEVDVRRRTGMISMTTLLHSFPTPDDCGKTQSTAKRYALPIASTQDGSWTCSSLQDDADDEVSKREKLAARKALACARAVDDVFAGLPWM